MNDLREDKAPQPRRSDFEDEIGASTDPQSDAREVQGRGSTPEVQARQDLLASLNTKLAHKLASPLDEETQAEISHLVRLMTSMRWEIVEQNRAFFELAFDLLAADEPNMIVIRNLRYTLGLLRDRSSRGLSRLLALVSGESPLHAVLSALALIVALSFLISLFVAWGHHLISMLADQAGDDAPILKSIHDAPITQIVLLLHAAFLGSVVSITLRVKSFLDMKVFNAVLVFVSVLTRPFVSVMFALLAFAMLKAGVVSFLGVDLNSASGNYIAWVLGFVCGFSERMARDFVDRAGATFGERDPLNPDTPN